MPPEYVHQISDAESRGIRTFFVWTAIVSILLVVASILFLATADWWLRYVSHSAERRFVAPYIEFFSGVSEQPEASAQTEAWLQSLADRLVQQQQFPSDAVITVHYLSGDELNAFATLGGHIFIYDGLIRSMPGENALAMILSHEIAHVKNRDVLVSVGRGVVLQLLLSGVSDQFGSVETMTDVSAEAVIGAYSREQELEADSDGLDALYGAYGHVGGALKFFELALEQESIGAGGSAGLDGEQLELLMGWLATHPDTESRIAAMNARIQQKEWPEKALTPYPAWMIEEPPETDVGQAK